MEVRRYIGVLPLLCISLFVLFGIIPVAFAVNVGETGSVPNFPVGLTVAASKNITFGSGAGLLFPDGSTQTTGFTGTAIISAGQITPAVFGSLSTKGNYTFQKAATADVVLFVDATNGRVGVGTASPGVLLDVSGSDASELRLVNANGSSPKIHFRDNTAGQDSFIYSTSGGLLTFATESTANAMVITGGGNVGIGTTGPTNLLTVSGALTKSTSASTGWGLMVVDTQTAAAGVGGGIHFVGYKTAQTAFGNFAAIAGVKENATSGDEKSALLFYTDTGTGSLSEAMRITSGGNVGIGTTSPSEKLTIKQTTGNWSALNVYTEGVTTGQSYGLTVQAGTNSSDRSFGVYNQGGGSSFLYVRGDGNVGIGATSPAVKTHIFNTVDGTFTGLAIDNRKTYGAGTGTNETSRIILSLSEAGAPNPLDRVMGYVMAGTENENSSVNGFIALGTRVSGAETEKIRISSAGNVGIGTTSPGNKLQVYGTNGASNDFSGYTGVSDGVTPNGAEIQVNINRPYTYGTNGPTYRGGLSFGSGGGVGIYSVNPNPAGSTFYGDIRFYTTYWNTDHYENADRMVIDFYGNVGIGTTSPGAKLHVSNGDSSFALFGPNTTWSSYFLVGAGTNGITSSRAQAISTNGNLHLDSGTDKNTYVNYYSQTNTFINAQGGNVGIGTTSPGYKLDVAGSARISGANNGIYLPSGQGFYQNGSDSWIRTFNDAPIWAGSGIIATNGSFSVGYGGTTGPTGGAILAGNVGIGTSSPASKLDVYGAFNLGGGSNGGTIYAAGFTRVSGLATPSIFGNGTDALVIGGKSDGTGTVAFAGNVGIGTAGPDHKLHVFSSASEDGLTIDATTYPELVWKRGGVVKGYFGIAGSAGGYGTGTLADSVILRSESAYMHLLTSSGLTMTINGSNVGIGTTGPGAKLEVAGQVKITGGTPGAGKVLTSDAAGLASWTTPATGVGGSGTASYIPKFTAATTLGDGSLYESSGNIGLGTTSPSGRLDIRGTGTGLYVSLTSSAFGLYTTGSTYGVRSTGNLYGLYAESTASSTGSVGVYGYGSYIGTYGYGKYGISGYSSAAGGYAGYFEAGGTASALYTKGSVTMTGIQAISLDDTKSVLWGTSSQAGIKGVGGSSGYVMLSTNGTGNGIYLKAVNGETGNVGIGTATPTKKLDVYGDMAITNGGHLTLAGDDRMVMWGTTAQTYVQGKGGGAGTGYLDVGIDGTSGKFRILSNGNVGVGTVTPTRKLDVYGDVAITNSGVLYMGDTRKVSWGSSYASYIEGKSGSTGGYIDVGVGGTNARLHIDDAGNVGIGTQTPGASFDVSRYLAPGGANVARFFNTNSSGEDYILVGKSTASAGSAVLGYSSSGGQYGFLRIAGDAVGTGINVKYGGNVGIGTTSPTKALMISRNDAAVTENIVIHNPNNNWSSESLIKAYGDTDIAARVATAFGFYRGASADSQSGFIVKTGTRDSLTTRLIVDNSGNVGIGTMSPGYTLTVSGTAWVTSGAWSGSDIRWKKNVAPLASGNSLGKVMQLKPVSFEWKTGEFPGMHFSSGTQLGFIAQDVERVIPEVVTTDNNGYKGISYERLVPVITAAVQEEQKEIEVLKAENASLKARIEALERRVK